MGPGAGEEEGEGLMVATGRNELDRGACADPVCTHDHSTLFVRAACHIHAGLEVSYEKRHGALTIRCKTCKALVVRIAVANETREMSTV